MSDLGKEIREELAGGKGAARGVEVLRPAPRKIEVARSYVLGLEADSRELLTAQADLGKIIWQAATISNHNRTLQRMLEGVRDLVAQGVTPTEYHLEQIDEVLKVNQMMSEEVFTCLCGHSTFDHDEKGCQFLGCRPICGQ